MFIAVALFIGVAPIAAPFLVAVQSGPGVQVSAYECGFNAFDDARMKFDVRFYLVSILFIIFDLEVAFLFPWAVAFKQVGAFGFWSMMAFLAVLTIGFIYEWRRAPWNGIDRGRAVAIGKAVGRAARPDGGRRRRLPRPVVKPGSPYFTEAPTSSPTRASSSPPPTTSSTGRAPAR